MDADVIVIGAGLAGLQCARRAQRSGRRVIVLESEDGVGGRVRTDHVDGFLCDRGFQLLNPAYPAVATGSTCALSACSPSGSVWWSGPAPAPPLSLIRSVIRGMP